MIRILTPLLSASLLLCSSAFSQETQPPLENPTRILAQEIAAGIAGLKDKTFELDLSLESKGDGEGGVGETSASGHIAWAGLRMFSIEISATVLGDLGEEEESFRVVADGTDIYMEAGEQGIIKVNIDALGELQPQLMAQVSEQGLELGASSGEEGVSFEETLADALSKLTIKALPSPTGAADRAFSFIVPADFPLDPDDIDAPAPDITVVFTKEHWIPTLLAISVGEEDQLQLSHTNIRIMEAFPEGTFAYTPPEGEMVQDFTPMLQMLAMQAAQESGDEDELEF